MRLRSILAVVCLVAAAVCAHGDTLAAVTGGTDPIDSSLYLGQSFSVFGSGSFTDINFNFYAPGESPYSIGTEYLFSAPYMGTPIGLNSASPDSWVRQPLQAMSIASVHLSHCRPAIPTTSMKTRLSPRAPSLEDPRVRTSSMNRLARTTYLGPVWGHRII
jgi:hypothetical protein